MCVFAWEFIVLVSSWSWHSEEISPQVFGILTVKHMIDIDLKREDFQRTLISLDAWRVGIISSVLCCLTKSL